MSAEPWAHLCSLARIDALHLESVALFGGSAGVRDPGCPEATLGNAWNACGYAEIEESLEHVAFAVYLLYYFATKQCFADGNKRIAWLSMCEVLSKLDLEVQCSDSEGIDLVFALANKKASLQDAMTWVVDRLGPISKK